MRDDFAFSRRGLLKTSGALAGAGLLGAGASPATAAGTGTGPTGKPYRTTSGKTEPEYELGAPYHVYVPTEYEMPDGSTEDPQLYAEVIRPVDPDTGELVEDVPVILTYSPYNDLRSANRQAPDALEASSYDPTSGSPPDSEQFQSDSTAHDPTAEYFVKRGYARVMVDLVGTRNSGGYYDYGGIRERLTGKQLVEWFADREWSNGKVGMIGGSYDGTTQWAAAIEQPDGLATIVPQVAIDRWYDYAVVGGCRLSTVGTPSLFDFGFSVVPPLDADPQAAQNAVDHFRPGDRLEHMRETREYDILYDGFWDERDYKAKADRIECSAYVEGGWLDSNVKHWDSTRMWQALPDDHPKKLVMGQWAHNTNQLSDALDVRHAWFDHWLMDGVETDVMDLPRVDTQINTGERFQHEEFPPQEAREVAVPLVRSEPDAGELELLGSGQATYQDTVQGLDESDMYASRGSGDDHLMFETPPLKESVRFAGTPLVDALLAVENSSAHVAGVLYQRNPDGSVKHIARGARNGKNRNTLREHDAIPTDRAFRTPVPLIDIDHEVPEGARLGLVVAADNGTLIRRDPDGRGTHELVLDGSALRLPVVGDAAGLSGAKGLPRPSVARDPGDGPAAGVVRGGRIAQVSVECTGIEDGQRVRFRDRVPAGWDVAGGDGRETTVEGATYVEFGPTGAGTTRDYFAEAPSAATDSGEHTFGPVEYSPDGGANWYTLAGTTTTRTVVGTGVPEVPESPGGI